VALDIRASNQIRPILMPTNNESDCNAMPKQIRPKPTLSALVSACMREKVSLKRSKPTVPAKKKNAPERSKNIDNELKIIRN
jgi:hypothetical protein